jgi:zinc protease
MNAKTVFHTTPGGVRTAVLAKPVRGDVVTVYIAFKYGNVDALKGQSAASVLASRMLDKGTARLNRQQIQDELTRLGAQLGMQFGNNGGGLSVTVKKANLAASLDLVLGVLQEASFPESEFELVRSAEIKTMQGQITDKASQASNAWSRYGNPYPQDDVRYRHTLEQWLAQVQATTRDQALAFYKRFYGAQQAQVMVVGPVDAAQVQQQLAKRLDNWKSAEAWVRLPDPLIERKPARLAYDTPDKANVSISAFQAVALGGKKLDPTDFAMDMATRIFGGGPGSRLWVALREKGGLSYSAGAHFQTSTYEVNGRLSLSAEVAPQNLKKAEAALQQELKRSLDEGFTAVELASFKQQHLAERKSSRTGDAWAMGFMYNVLEHGNGPEVYAKGDALIESLTLDQVNAAWRQFVQPQKLVWGVFGDQAKMQ